MILLRAEYVAVQALLGNAMGVAHYLQLRGNIDQRKIRIVASTHALILNRHLEAVSAFDTDEVSLIIFEKGQTIREHKLELSDILSFTNEHIFIIVRNESLFAILALELVDECLASGKVVQAILVDELLHFNADALFKEVVRLTPNANAQFGQNAVGHVFDRLAQKRAI